MTTFLCSRSAQLKTLFAILAASDSALAAHLRDIGAGECFFAYRMLVGWLACACHAALCMVSDTGCQSEFGPGGDACVRWRAGCSAAKGGDAGGGQCPIAMQMHFSCTWLA